ncbi:type I-A CRISPR-associated protein Cas7/Csa2 [Infirmifilum sp.]|uniref:type I-A CRISPR-associated protein Cas7/Csa2 n=1 Tax=Infirmifilum sp. TaxID=2856575 RepID=UPI003D0F6B86
MRNVWVSLSWRALVNIEALNMAESAGNYIKHRRAPIAFYDEASRSFIIKYVPVISGESLAHAYQALLAQEAHNAGLNVCNYCLRGELVKHGARVILEEEKDLPPLPKGRDRESREKAAELEKELIKRCVVEDVGGFLVPTEVPVKRTSLFYIGYMVPAYDSFKVAVADPQFHVRHAPSLIGVGEGSSEAGREEFRETGQAIYVVELASAVYTASAALNVTGIGCTSTFSIECILKNEERLKRAEVALKSLYYLLVGMFGAKRTRFLPHYRLLSAVAAVVKGAPFNVEPGHTKGFVHRTWERAQKFKELTGSEVSLFAYVEEGGVEVPEGVERAESPEDLIKKLKERALTALEGVLGT